MRVLSYGKDGGPESTVWGYWLMEFKSLFSVALLCFENGSREAYHTHAFNCISWVLKGSLSEMILGREIDGINVYNPSLKPVMTYRGTFHQVKSKGRTWVLTFRGPWADKWLEYDLKSEELITLTHGRESV